MGIKSKPDRFERMVERAHKHLNILDQFSKAGALVLLRCQYAAIRREIRRWEENIGENHSADSLLKHLDCWRKS